MTKRRLTAEDKKTLFLEYFPDTCEVFQLKELEKAVPRVTGIPQQNIKDLLQNLLDDDLVNTAKIGSSVYFWSYPGKAKQEKLRKLYDLQHQLQEIDKKIDEYQQSSAGTAGDEKNLSQITHLQEENTNLKEKRDQLALDLGTYDENDTSELWEKKLSDTKILQEAANRWTDNVFNVKSWCKKKFNCEDSLLEKQFGIPGDFDYLP